MSKSTNFLGGVLIGTIIGGLAGILMAPESGKDTIKKLKDLSEDFADNVKDFSSEAMEQVGTYKENLEEKVETLSSKVSEKVGTLKDQLEDKLEEAKGTIKEAMDELDEEEAVEEEDDNAV